MYNCRFLFTSIQRRTSLYYQFCHSVKNRDRVYMLQNRRRSFFLYIYLLLCADTKNRTPRKKNKKKQTRQFLPSIHYYFFVLIFSTFILLRVRFAQRYYVPKIMIKHYWKKYYRAQVFYKREYFNIFSVCMYQSLHFDEGTKNRRT